MAYPPPTFSGFDLFAQRPGDFALYLRKSRADIEAELRGEGETLSRHRRALLDLAHRRGMNVTHIFEEIVTGDSIDARPQMQALLADVERGAYVGVIVNDADRLARGDSIDQGIIKRAFYSTGTLIVTPFKTYDPRDSADEDFFDFSLFMARFEYKIIKRRMQTGRKRSAAEGNYLGTRVPYGYKKVKRSDRSGWTLEPIEPYASIVRQIFFWYVHGCDGVRIGAPRIAKKLTDMGLKTYMGYAFTPSTVRQLLFNPVYIGRVSWDRNVKREVIVDGQKQIIRVQNPEPILVENAHPAIIDDQLWADVQSVARQHNSNPPLPQKSTLSNVFAGLMRCSECGHVMRRRSRRNLPDTLFCPTYRCKTTSIRISIAEDAVLDALRCWVVQYSQPDAPENSADCGNTIMIAELEKNLRTIDKQLSSLHDLLEQGIYSPADFIGRRADLKDLRNSISAELDALHSKPTASDLIRAEIPEIKHVLDAYPLAPTAEEKNTLLRSIIDRIDYHKTVHCYRNQNPADYLTLTVHPKGFFN